MIYQNGSLENHESAHSFCNKYGLFFKNITLHLLLLITLLLSFLLAFTSALSDFSYNYYFSAFVFPLVTHTFKRKYMFLLCTSILTFITRSLKENFDDGKLVYMLSEMDDAPAVLVEENISIQKVEADDKVEDEQQLKETHEHKTNNECQSGVLIEDEEDDGGVYEEEGLLRGSSSVEEENAEAINMNTEELNKKIEEFIRKMREDLRNEAERLCKTIDRKHC